MSMRLWYQSMTPLEHLASYRESLQEHAERICSPGVEVSVNGVSPGLYRNRTPADVLKYPYAKLVAQQEVIDICRKAESDGFDAVILGSFSEPFLAEIRSVLDIPVVSMAESALLVACSLAEQFALVTLAPPNVKRVRALVRRHGFEGRVAAVLPLSKPVDEAQLNAALTAPKAVADDFSAVAARAVDAGVDVVVPAEGVLNLIVHRSGITTIGQATILDSVATALLYAELLVNLRRRVGTGVGRRWVYAKPPAELLADLAKLRRGDAAA
jgi:Asp/Glu/hydantoin racemase